MSVVNPRVTEADRPMEPGVREMTHMPQPRQGRVPWLRFIGVRWIILYQEDATGDHFCDRAPVSPPHILYIGDVSADF